MANINEILARAAALRDETALNSISPERAGGIMYDTLLALNELWLQQGAALVISKIYASVAAMEADTAPVSDLTGKPLRPGQIVVIASSDSDNGSVYRYNGTESPSWSLVGSIGNLDPVDSLDSDSTTLPLAAHQGKVLDGKISQLGQYIENPEWAYVMTDSQKKIILGVRYDGSIEWAMGVPTPIKEYIEKKIKDLSLDEYENIVGFLGDLINGDSTLEQLLAKKVDGEYVENPEFIKVITDKNNKLLGGYRNDGEFVIFGNFDVAGDTIQHKGFTETIIDNPEWVKVLVDKRGRIIYGIRKDGTIVLYGIDDEIKALKSAIKDTDYKLNLLPITSGDFNEELSESEFVSLYNSKLESFCSLCKCQVYGMNKLYVAETIEERCKKINHNFREDVVFPEMSRKLFMSQLNRYFSIPVYRFADAKLNLTNDVNASLRVGVNGVQYDGLSEPSALVSEDGQKIELFSSSGAYTETSDGVNWETPQPLVFHDTTWTRRAGHASFNKVDGKYMMVAHTYYDDDDYFDLLVSEDKINWYYKGHIFQNTVTDIGSGKFTTVLGNTYLFKDNNGKYYLFYEASIPNAGKQWEICLMSCDNILSVQEDGFVGDWVQCPTNPIIANNDYLCCNPEIIKGQNNQPIKCNGCYYMYYLSYTWEWGVERVATIRRAHSTDLVNWVDEGVVFDNRDTPDGGEHNADNGDQCLCEFKGRSFFFYTHNINNYGEGTFPVPISVRYTIDDRPFFELLKIKA